MNSSIGSERPKSIPESNSQKGPSRNTINEVSHQLPAFPLFCSFYVALFSSEFFEVQLYICCERLSVLLCVRARVLSLSEMCEKRVLSKFLETVSAFILVHTERRDFYVPLSLCYFVLDRQNSYLLH